MSKLDLPFFFRAQHHRNQLCLEAVKWIGTPFVPHAAVRGAGVDCVNLVGQILIACGHAKGFELPHYAMDGGKHNRTSQLCDYLDGRADFARINPQAAAAQLVVGPAALVQPGDVLCFTIGRSSHHVGMLVHGKTFVHALFGRKVSFGSLSDGVFKRSLTAIYRPLEVKS
jgi:cell wall-associated NlpC family hydrolase